MILTNKNAVVYGAGGAIGGMVARTFAREGARVFLTGRNTSTLELLADQIISSGGEAHVSFVDALNESEISRHLDMIDKRFGSIDISFNAMGIPQTGVQGISLLELTSDAFMLPIATYTKSHFLTGREAAKRMVHKGAGVIIMLTATPSRIAAPLVGGMASAWSALESMTRTMAGELGSMGVRVVCLRADGMPETDTITEVYGLHAKGEGLPSNIEFQQLMENMTVLKRLPKLSELANVVAFIASDQASAMTGTTVNVSCGSVVD